MNTRKILTLVYAISMVITMFVIIPYVKAMTEVPSRSLTIGEIIFMVAGLVIGSIIIFNGVFKNIKLRQEVEDQTEQLGKVKRDGSS